MRFPSPWALAFMSSCVQDGVDTQVHLSSTSLAQLTKKRADRVLTTLHYVQVKRSSHSSASILHCSPLASPPCHPVSPSTTTSYSVQHGPGRQPHVQRRTAEEIDRVCEAEYSQLSGCIDDVVHMREAALNLRDVALR